MSIAVEVGLLSGRTAAVKTGLNGSVGTLKHREQTALGVGKGRLLDRSGNVLDACTSVKRAKLQNGDRSKSILLMLPLLPSWVMDPP